MNIVPLVPIEQAGFGASLGAGFFVAKWFVEWLSRRLDKREERLDARGEKLLDSLVERVTNLEARNTQLESYLADCQKKHAESEAERMKLNAILEAKGIINQKAQMAIAAERHAQGEIG